VAVVAAALGTGCYATASGGAYGPDLVTVSPGVQVIADYDEPIFYSDGFYWRNYGGGWYRSTYYTGGWVYAAPPVAILSIDRPYAYRHYHPSGWQGRPVQPQPRYYGGGGWRGGPAPAPVARPLNAPPPGGGWRGGPAPAPVARPLTAPPPGGGWRGGPGQAPTARPLTAPAPRQQQGRPAPARPGWKGSPQR